jgi:hypothetical protein
MHAYCVQELQLSDAEAFNRIEAARAGRVYPRIFSMLAEGSLTVTTVQLLARKLTAENHDTLLTAAAGRTKNEVQELLARHFPQPDVPDAVRKLPSPSRPAPEPASSAPGHPARGASTTAAPAPPARPSPRPARPQPAVTPLAPDRYKITFTGDSETCELLEMAKDMLSHTLPAGETAEVVKRALKTLVSDLARRKFAITTRRKSRGPADDQDIPAAVKCEVWLRDGGRCRFVSASGRRCGTRRYPQFHHVISRANGGKATTGNIELRCGPHNRYEDDRESGSLQRRLAEGGFTRSGTSEPPPLFAP